MKKSFKLLSLLLIICIVFSAFACTGNGTNPSTDSSSVIDQQEPTSTPESSVDTSVPEVTCPGCGENVAPHGTCEYCNGYICVGDHSECGKENPEEIDYAASVQLITDGTNTSVYTEVESVRSYIDGDTTHFYVDESIVSNGILKARYLAINTPESTGKIEPWGKAAAQFTKSKLLEATSIIIESDTNKWNVDSTGDRHLVWVWYKTADSTSYRNLNIEILQNGLAIASNSANNKYGETCMNAIAQAKALSYRVHSNEKDPQFPYGEAQELTLKELRLNVEQYDNCNVAFEGVITKDHSQTIYVESYDEETDMYYGMQVYYGFNPSAGLPEIISVGNKVRIVGTVTYYETGNTYQVSGLTYNLRNPDLPTNTKLISTGHKGSFRLTTAETFANATVTIYGEEGTITRKYSDLALYTSIEMHDLYVSSIYTTNNGGDSDGAMTLTCKANGVTIYVRTAVLRYVDGDNSLVVASDLLYKTIDVRGIVNVFDGQNQINVVSIRDITIH